MIKEDKEHEIRICLGSSCFSRGNRELVKKIQQYLLDKGLDEKVNFRGSHCFGNCQDGPIIEINGNQIFHVEIDKIEALLAEHKIV